MNRNIKLHPDMPEVCRLGLATRGNSRLSHKDVHDATERESII